MRISRSIVYMLLAAMIVIGPCSPVYAAEPD